MLDGEVLWLEWARLFVSLLTPIAVVAIGYILNARLRSIEERRWLNQKVIEKRLQLFESMAPKLNDLLCYFTYVGHWKELQPPHIIALKRELDKEMHVHEALFPTQLHRDYDAFMDVCYKTFGGVGKDARLRTGYRIRKSVAGDKWQAEWEPSFLYEDRDDESDRAEKSKKRDAYQALMASFASALGVTDNADGRAGGRTHTAS